MSVFGSVIYLPIFDNLLWDRETKNLGGHVSVSTVYDRSIPSLYIEARNGVVCLLSLTTFCGIGRQEIEGERICSSCICQISSILVS